MTVTEVSLTDRAKAPVCSQPKLLSIPSSRWGKRLAALLVLLSCWGCGEATHPPESDDTKPRVFLDRKSKEYFVGIKRGANVPVNPETGKPTLSETLYCPKCQQWHAVPPLEVLLKTPAAGRCAKTKTPLKADGPFPEKAKQLPKDSAIHSEP